jgi:hypothetical protein
VFDIAMVPVDDIGPPVKPVPVLIRVTVPVAPVPTPPATFNIAYSL